MSTEHAVRAARTRQPSGVTWCRSVVAQCMRRVASREEERMRGTKAPTVAVTTATSVVPGIAGQCPPGQRGVVNAATGTECAPVPEPAQDQPTWCSTDCVPEFEQLGHLFICDCMHQCTQRVNLYTSVTACVSCTVLYIHQHTHTHTHPCVARRARAPGRRPVMSTTHPPARRRTGALWNVRVAWSACTSGTRCGSGVRQRSTIGRLPHGRSACTSGTRCARRATCDPCTGPVSAAVPIDGTRNAQQRSHQSGRR